MAQTQLYLRKAQVHLIVESIQDTLEVPVVGSSILAQDVTVSYDTTNFAPNYIRADFQKMDEIPGPISGTVAFSVPLKGSAVADTAPEWGACMQACGCKETVTATTGPVLYEPVNTFDGAGGNPGISYTVALLVNGTRHAIIGAFGTFTITGETTGPAMINFTFTGNYTAHADDALLVISPAYDASIAPAFRGGAPSVTFGGAYAVPGFNSFSFDLGNVVTLLPDVASATGFDGARITDRKSTFSFSGEMVLQATKDFFAAQRAGTSFTFTTGLIGSTDWNQYTFAVNRAIFQNIAFEDREGIHGMTVTAAVSSLASDIADTNPEWELNITKT